MTSIVRAFLVVIPEGNLLLASIPAEGVGRLCS
jgi:hypothetical protein